MAYLDGKYHFPLADGDLSQPGLHEEQARHRKLKRRRKAEKPREEEAARQSPPQAAPEHSSGSNSRDRQAGSDSAQEDLPTSQADFWTCNDECLVRHHKTPRTDLFIPTDDNLPIPFRFIDATRRKTTNSEIRAGAEIIDF